LRKIGKDMSFSSDAKREIIKNTPKSQCCKAAMLYGSLLFGKNFHSELIEYSSENEDYVKHQKSLINTIFNDDVHAYMITRQNARLRNVHTLHVVDPDDIDLMFKRFGHSSTDINLRIFANFLQCENCRRAFLAGVFISAGRVTDPEKEYHLEFSTSKMQLSEDLLFYLKSVNFAPKQIKRGNDYVLYFKDSREIEDVLTFIGAPTKSLDLMNVKIFRELRNQANRSSNCDIANQEKTSAAGQAQIDAIDYIFSTRGYDYLPTNLQEVALLRKMNPDSPLSELAELSESKLTRSGIHHRLNKIKTIAAKLMQEDQNEEQ